MGFNGFFWFVLSSKLFPVSYSWGDTERPFSVLKKTNTFIKNYCEYLKETLLQPLHLFSPHSSQGEKGISVIQNLVTRKDAPKIDLAVPAIRHIDITLFRFPKVGSIKE